MAPILVYATLGIATAILASASLNFLGMGAKPPTPEWGLMLSESRSFIRTPGGWPLSPAWPSWPS